MQKRAVATGALLALFAVLSPALADSDSDQLIRAGMIGTWTFDCNALPSKSNPYITYAPSVHGSPTRTVLIGVPVALPMEVVTEVRSIAEDRISLTQTSPDGSKLRLILLLSGNRHRSLQSIDGKGSVLIKDGRFTKDGSETRWLTRCPAR